MWGGLLTRNDMVGTRQNYKGERVKKYLVTEITTRQDQPDEHGFAGYSFTDEVDRVELPLNGKWLTREEVDTLVYQIQEHSKLQNKIGRQTIRREALDALFGDKP